MKADELLAELPEVVKEKVSEEDQQVADSAVGHAVKRKKKNRRKKSVVVSKPGQTECDDDERRLESLVFGLESDLVSHLRESASSVTDTLGGDGLFQLDRRGDVDADDDDVTGTSQKTVTERRAAWEDEDDEMVTVAQVAETYAGERRSLPVDAGRNYRAVLQRKFSALVGEPEWASLDRKRRHSSDSEADSDAESLLTKTGHLLAAGDKPTKLTKGTIVTKRCGNLTAGLVSRPRTVTALQFHKQSQVALVGGGGRAALAVVQVDGKENPLVQQVPLEAGFRVQCARFSSDGEHVLASSEYAAHLLSYDMMSGQLQRVEAPRNRGLRSVPSFTVSPDGRWLAVPGARGGAVHLLSARSREWVDTLQASGRVTVMAFSPDATRLFTHTDEGTVYEWDMSARRCVHRFTDEGCLRGSAVAISDDGRLIACGSDCGVVNVYETAVARQRQHPTPIRVLDQLTTECNHLLFNSTGDLLAMASAQKEHAVRLVHVPTLTVFSNFPGWSQAIQEPHSLDFSVNSGYLTVGNNKGRALLYRLQHYDNY